MNPYKVLIAEDTPIQGKKLKFHLNKMGYDVDWALNGQEAWEMLNNDQKHYDIVLSDVQMPHMSGVQLLTAIRKEEKYSYLPVVILTTLEDKQTRIQALKQGASDFLHKPYLFEELELRMRNLLSLYEFQKLIVNENLSLNHELAEKNEILERRFVELEQAHEELKSMQLRLIEMEKLGAMAVLGAGIAHEINNPLTSISGHNKRLQRLLQKGDEDRENLQALNGRITENVNRISKIVHQLKSLTCNRNTSQSKRLEINEFLKGLESLYGGYVGATQVKLQNHYAKDKITILANETSLAQAVLNLIQNASQAMENSDIKQLKIATSLVNGRAIIEVSDTGPGIPEEMMTHIFEPFFTTKGPGKGTGLGLALVKSYVNSLGGEVRVQSSSLGTSFELEFPVAG